MLPLIDMCNHSFNPNCKLQPVDNGDLQLIAIQDIPQQQPLQLSYGNLSNDFLLMDYGFVVPSNPFDRVQLSFNLDLLEVQPLSSLLLCGSIAMCTMTPHFTVLLVAHAAFQDFVCHIQ